MFRGNSRGTVWVPAGEPKKAGLSSLCRPPIPRGPLPIKAAPGAMPRIPILGDSDRTPTDSAGSAHLFLLPRLAVQFGVNPVGAFLGTVHLVRPAGRHVRPADDTQQSHVHRINLTSFISRKRRRRSRWALPHSSLQNLKCPSGSFPWHRTHLVRSISRPGDSVHSRWPSSQLGRSAPER